MHLGDILDTVTERRTPMINFDIRFGFKEIVAAAVSIPLVYKKIRQLKLKYDEKEKKILNGKEFVFNGVLIDQYGQRWIREDKAYDI